MGRWEKSKKAIYASYPLAAIFNLVEADIKGSIINCVDQLGNTDLAPLFGAVVSRPTGSSLPTSLREFILTNPMLC